MFRAVVGRLDGIVGKRFSHSKFERIVGARALNQAQHQSQRKTNQGKANHNRCQCQRLRQRIGRPDEGGFA